MAKETVGLKLDSELAAKFKELQGAAGGTAQDFVETLLAAHADRQEDTNTASPIYKEQVKVRQGLSQIERIVSSYLELAAADKIAAEEHARDAVEAARAQVAELDAQIKMDIERIKDLQDENQDLIKKVAGLEDQAESLETLKEAWIEKENNLNARIASLDAEAQESRDLKIKILDLDNLIQERADDITEFEQQLALAGQKAESDQAIINDLRTRLESDKAEHDSEVESIKGGYRSSIADLKASHDTTVNDLKAQITTESRRVDTTKQDFKDEIEDLKEQYKADLEKKDQEMFGLIEEHRQSKLQIEDENRGLAESVKTLDDELYTEKLSCATRISEIQTLAAEEKGQLSGELQAVKGQLENLRPLPEKVASLDSQLQNALSENHGLSADLENAQREIANLKKVAKK